MKEGARRLPELAGDDLCLPHPRRHRCRRDLAPKREGAGRQHLESSAAVLCSVSAYLLAPLPGAAALVLHLGVAAARRTGGAGAPFGRSRRAAVHHDKRVGWRGWADGRTG